MPAASGLDAGEKYDARGDEDNSSADILGERAFVGIACKFDELSAGGEVETDRPRFGNEGDKAES